MTTNKDNVGKKGDKPLEGGAVQKPVASGAVQKPVEPVTPSTNEFKEGETVSIDRKVLDEIIKRQNDLEKDNENLKGKIDKLTHAADKKRIADWESRHQGELTRTANISTWRKDLDEEPKIVLGWKMVKDDVRVSPGRVEEIQIVRIYLDNGNKDPDSVDLNYLDWSRNVGKIRCDIVDYVKTSDKMVYILRLPDNRQIEMDPKYINAF